MLGLPGEGDAVSLPVGMEWIVGADGTSLLTQSSRRKYVWYCLGTWGKLLVSQDATVSLGIHSLAGCEEIISLVEASQQIEIAVEANGE